MKKIVVVAVTIFTVLSNVFCANASENLDKFDKALEGTWERVNEFLFAGVRHSWALTEEIVYPSENLVLTEDSTGVVHILGNDGSMDTPTFGIVTLSSDGDIMVIEDTVGGFIVYSKK